MANVIVYGDDLAIEGASDNVEEGKNDLALGKVLIISKDGNTNDPNDDEAGGQLVFNFNGKVQIESVDLLDINEAGGSIQIFNAAGQLLSTTVIPALGENTFQTVFVKGRTDGTPFEASRMVITLKGDGAVSQIVYTDVDPPRDYEINHQYIEESVPGTPHQITVTVTDDDGGTATLAAGKIEVTNGPPIIRSLVTIPVTADLNSLTVIGRFVDSSGDLHTATVFFGDGTVLEAFVVSYDPATGRFTGPTYPGTTDAVEFIDPVTGDAVPLVDPLTGEFNLAGLVDPVTGKMSPLRDPDSGGPVGTFAVLDASTRQVYATHRYGGETTYTITLAVTDEEAAVGTDSVSYRTFVPVQGRFPSELKPVDIVQNLQRLGFDISTLVGGSGLFGDRIASGIFGGMGYDMLGGDSLAVFVGRSAPGGIVILSFYDNFGGLMGREEVEIQGDGYWFVSVPGEYLKSEGSVVSRVQLVGHSWVDGSLEHITYDFAPDSIIEDALRNYFEIGELTIHGRLISPVEAGLNW